MTEPARAVTRARAADFFAASLAATAHRVPADAIAVISAPAETGELPVLPRRDGILWCPPDHAAMRAGEPAAVIQARGPRRYAQVQRQAAQLWRRIVWRQLAGAAAPPPRLWGGFAFAVGSADREPWCDLGDARFVLPSWCAGSTDDGCSWLTIACANVGDPRARRRAIDRLEEALDRPPDDARVAAVRPAVIAELELDRWRAQVEAIRTEIVARRSEKIVAARRTDLELADSIDPRAAAGRLAVRHRDCFVFALGCGDSTFIGASPERLIARCGDRILSGALAGSIARGGGCDGDAAGQRLLASAKDRGEQALVARDIERKLRPLCRELEIPSAPRVRVLRDVLHLETPIAGRLARPAHVLALVEALHPTPAVGGVPTDAALAWIARTEATPRGWYAGPIGWFDAEGDGELAVAIRSGLVCGRRAYIYAGAGIVGDSDPDAEYDETQLKQRALLGALGVVPNEPCASAASPRAERVAPGAGPASEASAGQHPRRGGETQQ